MTAVNVLTFARFVHYLGLSVLFGVALFQLYGVTPSTRRTLPLQLRPFLLGSALATWISALWFGSEAGTANAMWVFRLALATVLVLVLARKQTMQRHFHLVVFGSLILLLSISLTGHSGSDQSEARILHRIVDAIHLAAAAIWIGALAIFARASLRPLAAFHETELEALQYGLSRFSETGPAVVIALALSGLLNPNVLSSFNSDYGRLLLVKLGLFAAMLLLATANRYWLTPALSRTSNTDGELKTSLRLLQASLLIETILAVAILAIVGWLGTIPPPAL